jgi:hypothetical protein
MYCGANAVGVVELVAAPPAELELKALELLTLPDIE